jgi:D-alanyl-D-alanine carboxypeptidase/D-alanyl-D-alanine-endopeptidase (penicillin-binding protein 4)
LAGCSSSKRILQKDTLKFLSSVSYENQFTGLLVLDAEKKDTLLNFNGKRYFTPASVTKIFTLFAASELLPEYIPSATYLAINDNLYIEGNGDPTQLHFYYKDSTLLSLMADYEHINVHLNNFTDDVLGQGWSWDDYQYYYQVEKGALPLYGNVLTLSDANGVKAVPQYFRDSVFRKGDTNRELVKNVFTYGSTQKDTLEIPFKTSSELTKNLLQQASGKEISLISEMPSGIKQTLYSVPTDSVLKRMMHQSDNFLAEQLMVLASSTLSDSLDVRLAIKHILENQLKNLKQKPRWVDGSGLSRYNLFTPESVVQVLDKMYASIPQERLFDFFPAGGVSGTLEDWYLGDPEPYVYAKTGTLGNTHNLSGYLLTKSGKTLIFSFMNNHFRRSSVEVKENMQYLLEQLRDNY